VAVAIAQIWLPGFEDHAFQKESFSHVRCDKAFLRDLACCRALPRRGHQLKWLLASRAFHNGRYTSGGLSVGDLNESFLHIIQSVVNVSNLKSYREKFNSVAELESDII
jgi:hypothetical protein